VKKVKVRVVRFKGKEVLVEFFKAYGFDWKTHYIEEGDEEEGIVYRYEQLIATGTVDGMHVVVECDVDGCKVEIPQYRHDGVEPCSTRLEPSAIKECIDKVVARAKEVVDRVGKLQAIAEKLKEYGFELNQVGWGAYAYKHISRNGNGFLELNLSPRISLIRLQLEAQPDRLVQLAISITKLLEASGEVG
jgi:hypothetical protein